MADQIVDPFSAVFATFWDTAIAHPQCNRLVRAGNRIRLDSIDRAPMKEQVAAADLPELLLTLDGGSAFLRNTSTTTKVVKRYTWIVVTGDMRVDALIHPVEWMLLEAMLDVHTTLGALLWSGEQFVKRVDISQITEGLSDSERNRGLKGWTALLSLEVEMYFKTSAMLAWKS